MSCTKIWIHAVWATKSHQHFLVNPVREEIFSHIKANAKAKGIEINFINGSKDHVHCLLRLTGEQSTSRVIQLIKGESSSWINVKKIIKGRFEWAHEYFAGSVSESLVDTVRNYIKNQEYHHARMTFTEEYEAFLVKHGKKPMNGEGVAGFPQTEVWGYERKLEI